MFHNINTKLNNINNRENVFNYGNTLELKDSIEDSSFKAHSVIINQCTKIPILEVDIKIERETDCEEKKVELYADHAMKEEIVIGPVVLQQVNFNNICFKDAIIPKKETSFLKKDEENPTTMRKMLNKEANKKLTEKSRLSNGTKKTTLKNHNIKQQMAFNIMFNCNDCGKHFKEKCKLVRHIECHEKIKRCIYLNCAECTYKTVSQEALKRHMKLHDRNRENECKVCGNRYRLKTMLFNHLRNVHSGKKMHECGICDYKTNDNSSINKHLQTHSGKKPYSCSICEFKCNFKCNLEEHLRTHSGEKPFSCPLCEYKSSGKSSLTRHIRIHTGEKPFSCSMCDYKSSRKTHLKEHINVHNGVKPFSCSSCEYKCTSQSSLAKHVRIHTDGKPYCCTTCDYKCSIKRSLTKHLRTHTG